MNIIDNAKDIADLIRKIGNVELYRKIVDLQGEIVSLSTEKLRCEQENAALRERLELKGAMKFRFPYYYQDGDQNPYCRVCWETKGIAVHLDHGEPWNPGNTQRLCQSCGQLYFDRPNR